MLVFYHYSARFVFFSFTVENEHGRQSSSSYANETQMALGGLKAGGGVIFILLPRQPNQEVPGGNYLKSAIMGPLNGVNLFVFLTYIFIADSRGQPFGFSIPEAKMSYRHFYMFMEN